MRLVDADTANIWLNAEACEQIKHMPTADVAPVRRGKWVPSESPFMAECADCSECGCKIVIGLNWNYCPNCGAKMEDGNHEQN